MSHTQQKLTQRKKNTKKINQLHTLQKKTQKEKNNTVNYDCEAR